MSFKLIFTFIFPCYLMTVSGQAGKASLKDSLVTELTKVRQDSARQKLYNELGNLFLTKSGENKTNIDSAFYYLRKSVYLLDSTNVNNNVITNESLCLLAATYFQIDNPTKGKDIFLQVIKNYQKARDKIKEADTWYWQGKILFKKEADLAGIQFSFEQSASLYFKAGDLKKRIDADYNLAFFHFRQGEEALAEKELLNLINVSKENSAYKLTPILLLLSEVKRYAGDLHEGLTYALDAEKSMLQSNDTLNTNHVYGELALEYEELNEPEKSIYWYKECIKERVKLHFNQYVIYRTAYLMIIQMIKVRKEQEALLILQNLKKSNPPVNPIENAILSQSLAYCFNSMGQYANAEKYFLSMIKVINEVEKNGDALFIANLDVGKFYVTQHRYTSAEPYLKNAFTYIEGPTMSRVKDLYLSMFKVDSAAGHYVMAIEHFQKYKAINDSLFNEAKSKQIEELMIKYDVDKKQQNFTILQKENIVQQKNLKQATLIRNFILAGVVSLGLIMVLLYNRYQFKQQANRKLEASQKEIEKQNHSLQRLVSEKEWLLKEIHHRVKNNLHTIIGLLDTQSGYLKTDEALIAISDSQHRVQTMSLIHQKLFHSESLSTVEMSGYIHELVGYLEHSFGTRQSVKFKLDIDDLVLNLSHALPIGLILNEAITNAIKYAFPDALQSTISVRLKQQSANQYLLSIADNGKGLPLDFDMQKSRSMGMNLMQGLSEDILGVFSIKNNNGTEINILFVYDPSEGKDFSFHESLSSI